MKKFSALILMCVLMLLGTGCVKTYEQEVLLTNMDTQYDRQWLATEDAMKIGYTVAGEAIGVREKNVIKSLPVATEGKSWTVQNGRVCYVEGITLPRGYYRLGVEINTETSTSEFVAELRVYTETTKPVVYYGGEYSAVSANRLANKAIRGSDIDRSREFDEIEVPFVIQEESETVTIDLFTFNRGIVSVKSFYIYAISSDDFVVPDVTALLKYGTEEKLTYDENAIYYFELYDYIAKTQLDTRYAYDIGKLMSTLQGIVNRDGFKIFYNFMQPVELMNPIQSIDNYWLTEVMNGGYAELEGKYIQHVASPWQLLELFKDKINGVAVWDENVPATVNVALTACGVDNLLPVRYDACSQSIYASLTRDLGLPVQLDLNNKFTGEKNTKVWGTERNSSGSAKNDAYYYAIENYLKTNKVHNRFMGYYFDAFTLDSSGRTPIYTDIVNSYIMNTDYCVMNKMFIFDLYYVGLLDETDPSAGGQLPNDDITQPIGTDKNTMEEILAYQNSRLDGEFGVMFGYNPWWFKYSGWVNNVPLEVIGISAGGDVLSEMMYGRMTSQYGFLMEADAMGPINYTNASFYCKLPNDEYKQTAVKESKYNFTDASQIPNKYYIAIYFGDMDNATWANNMLCSFFNDSARGEIPIMWTVPPQAAFNRAPHVYNYLYRNAGPNDYFVFPNSGYGHTNFEYLGENPSPQMFYEKTLEMCDKLDIDVLGFLINDRFTMPAWMSKIWTSSSKLKMIFGTAALFDPLQDANGAGYVNQGFNGTIVNNIPFIRCWYPPIGNVAGTWADYVRTNALGVEKPSSPQFRALRTINSNPSFIVSELQTLMNEGYEIEVVDPYTMAHLMSLTLKNNVVSTGEEW